MLDVVLGPEVSEDRVATDAPVFREREKREECDPASLRARSLEKITALSLDRWPPEQLETK